MPKPLSRIQFVMKMLPAPPSPEYAANAPRSAQSAVAGMWPKLTKPPSSRAQLWRDTVVTSIVTR